MGLAEGVIPFKEFTHTIPSHGSGVVNYLEKKITNGITEDIHSTNFIYMIYFIAGKLKYNYPLYST